MCLYVLCCSRFAPTPSDGMNPAAGDFGDEYVTDATLKKFNQIAAALHFVQGTIMFVASQAVTNIKDFKLDLTTSFLDFNEETERLFTKTEDVGEVEIGVVAAVFLWMSAIAHVLVLVQFDTYLANLKLEINPWRWYEYAASSSMMICGIAMLFGCYDLPSLIAIFVCNASMNFFGLLMEKMNPPGRDKVDWTPFVFGCVAGGAPWVIVFMYFLGSSELGEIPGFVYGILVSYIVFFNTFPVNMYLQYAKKGKWAQYRYGEKVYIVLSLLSKSLLAWLVFGGTAQPN